MKQGKEINYYLRDVTIDDAKLLFSWRNDDLVRKNSFHSEPLVWDEHVEWLKSVLNDSHQFFYIMMRKDEPIGQVRIVVTDGEGTVSYSISEKFRGRGFGATILSLVEREMYENQKAVSLCAYVKKNNIASILTFEKLGYKNADIDEILEYNEISSGKTKENNKNIILFKKRTIYKINIVLPKDVGGRTILNK